MFKKGIIVRIKTPSYFCSGVYNNTIAKISGTFYDNDKEIICYVDLIKERDRHQVSERGFVSKGITIPAKYCYPINNKLSI